MQGVKDAFYGMLRERIAAGNAGRTVVVRGTVRPGVVVVENELPGASVEGLMPVEAFCLRWTGLRVDALGLAGLGCEVRYATDGTAGSAGMDRGRALAAMDEELSKALGAEPRSAAKADGTRVFWGACSYAAAVMRGERMERTATVEVYGYGD